MCGGRKLARPPEDVCSVHVQHDVRLVLLEGSVHLVQQALVATNIGSRWPQPWSVDELDPDACYSAVQLPDALGGGLKGAGGGGLLPVQHTVDGGTLADASHAHDHDSAGKGQGLLRLLCLQRFCCALCCLKAVRSAGGVAGLWQGDALC